MSFYTMSDGSRPLGDESANSETYFEIPEGTTANAKVISAQVAESDDWGKSIKFEYKLCDGDFKNAIVRHNVKCFDKDPDKKDKALNMLVRIMNLCKFKPSHALEPKTEDLAPAIGKEIQVKVGQMFNEKGMNVNFVRGVYAYNEREVETGIPATRKPVPPQTSFNDRNPPPIGQASGFHPDLNDDVPFK